MGSFDQEMNGLQEGEVRRFVSDILEKARSELQQGEVKTNENFATHMLELWSAHIKASRTRQLEAEEREKQVQLLFGISDAGSMKVALSQIGTRQESRVLAFNDLFAIGPLWHLAEEAGQSQRHKWLIDRFTWYIHDYLFNREHQLGHMANTIERIPKDKQITIWCGDNAHDQVGLRFALYLLRHRRQPIFAANATRAYAAISARYDNALQPIAIGQIPIEALEEILQLNDVAELLTEETRMRYEQEWRGLTDHKDTLRIWQEGSIKSVPEDYFDEHLTAIVGRLQEEQAEAGENDWVRAGRVVAEAIESWNQLLGDSFIDYRIWTLISDGRLEFKGLPGAIYRYSVRLPAAGFL